MVPRLSLPVLLISASVLLVSTTPAKAGVPPVVPGELLGSTGNVGASLISIDPGTGMGSFRFNLGSLGPVTEIEFRDDGVLFGTTGGGSSNVITIDPDTGVETLVGQHAFGAVNGLEFVGNVLYGSFFAAGAEGIPGPPSSLLVTVDTTDGSLTEIGPITGIDPVRGLAYDPSTGTLYGVGSQVFTEGVVDVLFTIDTATGAPSLIGPTGVEITGGIEFGPNGLLYGGIALAGGAGDGGIVDGSLVVLDLATGAATDVGPTGFSALSGLSFVPGGDVGGGPPVVEVPTISGLGLLLLMASLLAAGLLMLRRARAPYRSSY